MWKEGKILIYQGKTLSFFNRKMFDKSLRIEE